MLCPGSSLTSVSSLGSIWIRTCEIHANGYEKGQKESITLEGGERDP